MVRRICLVLLVTILSLTLTGCGEINSYGDMDSIVYRNILSKSSRSTTGRYYVFAHKSSCAPCRNLEELVTQYARIADKNRDAYPIYALNRDDKINNGAIQATSCDSEGTNYGVNADYYENIKLCSSPILFVIKDGVVERIIDLQSEIRTELNAQIAKYE